MRKTTVFISIVLILVLAGYYVCDKYNYGQKDTDKGNSENQYISVPDSNTEARVSATDVPETFDISYNIVFVDDLLNNLEANAYNASQYYTNMYVTIIAQAGNISADGSQFYLYESDEDSLLNLVDWHIGCMVSGKDLKDQLVKIKEGNDCLITGKIVYVDTKYYVEVHSIKVPDDDDYRTFNVWKKMNLHTSDLCNVIGCNYQTVCGMLPRVSKLNNLYQENNSLLLVGEEGKVNGITGTICLIFDADDEICRFAYFIATYDSNTELLFTVKLTDIYDELTKQYGKSTRETANDEKCSFYEAILLNRDFEVEWENKETFGGIIYTNPSLAVGVGQAAYAKSIGSLAK